MLKYLLGKFHGKFSMEFHGGLGHQFPWKFLHGSSWKRDIFLGIPWRIRTPISMEFHVNFSTDIFHGGLGHLHVIPWKNFMQFHRNYTFDYSMDLQGVSWNSQELEIRINNELNGIHSRFWSTTIYWISVQFLSQIYFVKL